MSNKKLNSLGRSLRIGSVITVLVICLLMGAAGFNTYYRGMIDRYQIYLHDLLELTLTEIDGDDLARCIESGQKSDKYMATQEFVDRIKETYEIEFLYIVKPLNTNVTDNMMNVMAAITAEEKALDEEFYSVNLGELTGEDYSPKVAAKYMNGMNAAEMTFFSNRTEYGHDYTGMIHILDSRNQPVAVLAADLSIKEIYETLRQYIVTLLVFILLLSAAAMGAIFFWLRRRIIHPIERLNTSVESFEHGNFDLELEKFKKDDELRNLALSFTDMTRRIDAYTEEVARATAEKGRISAENNVAKQIQTDILPGVFPAFPERRDFDIFTALYSGKDICGDFFDFFLIDDDHLGMVMGDVSGKGVPAAMFMVIVKTLIKNRALQGFSPAEVLQNVSEQVLEGNEAGMYATVWLAVLELSTGKGMAANAGFEHPVLCRAGKRFELQEYRHSPPVGAMEGVRFRDHGFQMEPGDALFLYTDGVKEAKNQKEETFGTARILEALNREPDATPSVLLQTMKSSIDSFCGEAQQMDDLTMLSLKYYGTGQPSDEWK